MRCSVDLFLYSVEHARCEYCPFGWVLHERKCYYFSEKKKTWSDSEKYCGSQTASLAVIDSEEEKVRKQLVHTSNGVKSAICIYQGEGVPSISKTNP
uniref:C-type lectin domain-containing protein n=1 Tax=Gopherus agassizii TaxID=38772 RepID=A0A452HUG5_9SAUR